MCCNRNHRFYLRHLRRPEGSCGIRYRKRRGPADRRSADPDPVHLHPRQRQLPCRHSGLYHQCSGGEVQRGQSGERPASDDSVAGSVPRHAVQQPVLLVHQPVHHPAHAGCQESGTGTERCCIHRIPQAAGSVLHHHLRSAGLPLLRRRPGKQRPGIPVSDHHGCSELVARHHCSGSVRCDPVVL